MKLPKPRKIIAEKYVAGLSLFKSRRSPIKLSANESALGPSPKAVKSYSSIGKGFVRYPDSDGTFFRKVLAKKFKIKREKIILGSGSDQIFELVCKLFLNKGDEVIVPTVSFIAPINAVNYCKANPIFMDVDDHLNIDVEKIISFLMIIFLNSAIHL